LWPALRLFGSERGMTMIELLIVIGRDLGLTRGRTIGQLIDPGYRNAVPAADGIKTDRLQEGKA